MILSQSSTFKKIYIVILISIFASLISYFQPFGISRDYLEYERFFDDILKNGCSAVERYRFEAGFNYLSCIMSEFFLSANLIYSINVFISILPKLTIISSLSGCSNYNFRLGLFVYFSRFFPLHELTQIRASLSITCVFYATFLISIFLKKGNTGGYRSAYTERIHFIVDEQNKGLRYLIFALIILFLLAILFHVSSVYVIVLVGVAAFSQTKKYMRYSPIGVLIFSFICSQTISKLIVEFIPSAITYGQGFGDEINLLSPLKLMDIAIVIGVFCKLIDIDLNDKSQVFFFNIFTYSISIYYGFFTCPAIAHRMSEFTQVFVVLFLISASKRKNILPLTILIFVVCLSSLYLTATKGYFN
jgi:ABC-type multidrug transport system fused ATPase/permease subunit